MIISGLDANFLNTHVAVVPYSRSTDRPLSAYAATESYFTAGLNNALNESQNRRNTLLDKLKEAQDTLQVSVSLVTYYLWHIWSYVHMMYQCSWNRRVLYQHYSYDYH